MATSREEILEQVKGALSEKLGIDESEITEEASFEEDLGADSLDLVEVVMDLEDQFGLKIQLIGRPDLADSVLPLHGEGLAGGPVKGTVVGYLAGEKLVAVAGFGAARYVVRYRAPLLAGADRAAALEFARSLRR